MAVYKDARVTWGGVVAAGIRSAAIELGAGAPDNTAMGQDWASAAAGGIKTAAVEIEFNSDAIQGTTTESGFTLWGTTSSVGQEKALVLSPTTAAANITSPTYTGNFIVTAVTPISGTVGDNQEGSVSLVLGSGGLAIASS